MRGGDSLRRERCGKAWSRARRSSCAGSSRGRRRHCYAVGLEVPGVAKDRVARHTSPSCGMKYSSRANSLVVRPMFLPVRGSRWVTGSSRDRRQSLGGGQRPAAPRSVRTRATRRTRRAGPGSRRPRCPARPPCRGRSLVRSASAPGCPSPARVASGAPKERPGPTRRCEDHQVVLLVVARPRARAPSIAEHVHGIALAAQAALEGPREPILIFDDQQISRSDVSPHAARQSSRLADAAPVRRRRAGGRPSAPPLHHPGVRRRRRARSPAAK